MRKMKHGENEINLSPFPFPMSLFFDIRDSDQTNFADALLV